MNLPPLAELEAAVTRRSASCFAADIERRRDELQSVIVGRRLLVIGGGGSIGSATTRALLEFAPAAIHVVDISENYLAELVREIRSGSRDTSGIDLQTHVFDYGAPTMRRFLAASAPFDAVLNFAAVKHVRSEKDVYSLLHMLDVNIVRQARFKQWLAESGHTTRYFTVSTDKAANPSSLMGASKRVMENVAFDTGSDGFAAITSARFANVAFSNGSLLQSFLARLQKHQPIAVPRDTRRYFISHREAAEICVLTAFLVPTGFIAIPALDPERDLVLLEDIATQVLVACGFEPWFADDEAAAKRAIESSEYRRRWPVFRSALDTSGEKSFEEFVGDDESDQNIGFLSLRGVPHHRGPALATLLDTLTALVETSGCEVDKAALVRLIGTAVPLLRHVESNRHLDERM